MNPERAIAYRKQAGALLEAVLQAEVSPRCAIHCWPVLGNQDPSVQCAYTMLWYFEADEDRHQREVYYSDVQIQVLQTVAGYLSGGAVLPQALLAEYQETAAPPEYQVGWLWRKPLWSLQRGMTWVRSILETHPVLHKLSRHNKTPL